MTITSTMDGKLEVIRMLKSYWFFAIPVFLTLRFLCYRYVSPLRKYPGPFIASGSRMWKVLSAYSGHTETDHVELHEKYGAVVRIAPNEVSFASPTAAREILAAGKGFNKTDFYGVFLPPENRDIFTTTDEKTHGVMKRFASAPYSMASMQQLTPFIEDTQLLLMKKLDGACQREDQYCNLGNYLHYFAFDTLGEVAFSRKFGLLEAGYDLEGALTTVDNLHWYAGIIGQIPEWNKVLRQNPLWKVWPFSVLMKSNVKIINMALEVVGARQAFGANQIDRKDLLASLMAANEKASDAFSMRDVVAVALGAIMAGSDTTASSMQSFCHFVLRYPAVHARLRAEFDQAAASGALSAMPQWNESQALPYFQACLKEAFRLRPAVGLNITRLVPSRGATIDGVSFPGKTRVAVNGWVLHRNEAIFGRDPKAFRPERWLEGDTKTMERFMFQFGGGSHLCIGKNLALLEMNKVLPLLFREYDMELLKPKEDLKHHTTFFVIQHGLEVRIKKRGNM